MFYSKKIRQCWWRCLYWKRNSRISSFWCSDRVFFATNKSSLTTAARETLRKQATYLRKNKNLNVTIEGHADERGTREYNLALGERRANAARDYLMTYGISGNRISVISYGKEKPVNPAGTPLAWSQNRRSVTVKVN